LDNESLAELLNALKGTSIEEASVEKPLIDLLRELPSDREIKIHHVDLKIADNGVVLLTLGYNTIPPSKPRLQFFVLDGEGNIVLKRRFYSVSAYPDLSTDGNVIVLHIPYRYLIAYNSSGKRLWIYEAKSWLDGVLLWWSLSADGRYAAVVLEKQETGISFHERYIPEVVLSSQLLLQLVNEGSVMWSRDLCEFSTPSIPRIPNVAISPGNKYVAVAQSDKKEVDRGFVEEFVRIKLYSIDEEELWSLYSSLGSTLGLLPLKYEELASALVDVPKVRDLEVLDNGRVLLCTEDKVASVEDGRIVWVKHFPLKWIRCRIARYCGRVLVEDGERIYVLDEGGEVIWNIESSKSGADMSDNCYTLLGSGNRVTLLSPSGEVVQRETLNGEAVYVRISPNGRYFLALTRNGVLHIFKSKA